MNDFDLSTFFKLHFCGVMKNRQKYTYYLKELNFFNLKIITLKGRLIRLFDIKESENCQFLLLIFM